MRHTTPDRRWLYRILALISIALLFAACSDSGAGTGTPTAAPTEVAVNGFGSAANHSHALLALSPNVLVMATHIGLFRSQDAGATWQEVAGGSHQLMDGLMTYSLTVSPLDPQRLYVLSQPAVTPHPGVPGIYTSADQGRTWQAGASTSSLTSGSLFMAAAGNENANEVYLYLSDLGAQGLRVSHDAGQHFVATGTLPFGRINGVLAIPGAPGQLVAYGSDGMAYSADGGAHWQNIEGIEGGVYGMTTASAHQPIYATGDAGIFVSRDGGKTFKLVYTKYSFASLSTSPTQPDVVYGKIGLAVYRSTDAGNTWTSLPSIKGNLTVLAVDPNNASQVYLSLSYPTAIYRLQTDGKGWESLTPKA